MKDDELRIRSEGALDVIDGATRDYEHATHALTRIDWLAQLQVERTLLQRVLERERRIEAASEQVSRLEPVGTRALEFQRDRLKRAVRAAMTELGERPTAERLDDLLAQLLAIGANRSLLHRTSRKKSSKRNRALGAFLASVGVVSGLYLWGFDAGVEFAAVVAGAFFLSAVVIGRYSG
jgi:hypothetical protein